MPFPVGGPLELSLYLQPFSRYSAQQMLTNERTNEHDGPQYRPAEVINCKTQRDKLTLTRSNVLDWEVSPGAAVGLGQ